MLDAGTDIEDLVDEVKRLTLNDEKEAALTILETMKKSLASSECHICFQRTHPVKKLGCCKGKQICTDCRSKLAENQCPFCRTKWAPLDSSSRVSAGVPMSSTVLPFRALRAQRREHYLHCRRKRSSKKYCRRRNEQLKSVQRAKAAEGLARV